jgi:hypothetical protein
MYSALVPARKPAAGALAPLRDTHASPRSSGAKSAPGKRSGLRCCGAMSVARRTGLKLFSAQA